MVQVPTDRNMADINTKPLAGQRIRFLMNLVGYSHTEEQTQVGDLEKKVSEERKNFEGKVNNFCQNRDF